MVADLLPLLVLAGLWIAGISALVSALRTDDAQWKLSGQAKGLTVAGVALTCGIGGLYYWLRIRPQLRRVAHLAPAPGPPVRRDPSPWDDGLGPR